MYNMDVYEKILENLEKREFDEELDIYQKPAENSFLKRLYRIISMPTDDIKVNSAQLNQEPDFNCHACVLDKDSQSRKKAISTKSRILAIFRDAETPECSCKGFLPIPQKSVHF